MFFDCLPPHLEIQGVRKVCAVCKTRSVWVNNFTAHDLQLAQFRSHKTAREEDQKKLKALPFGIPIRLVFVKGDGFYPETLTMITALLFAMAYCF